MTRKPSLVSFKDMLVQVGTSWSVATIQSALDAHDMGQFSQSSMLCEAMTRDDRFAATLNTRVLGLLGCSLTFDPSDDGHKSTGRVVARDAEVLRETVFGTESVAQLLRWAVMMGFGLAELVWNTGDGDEAWTLTLKPWHPQYVYYKLDTRSYGVYTQDGPVDITPGDGKWFLYAPSGTYRAWMQGAVRSCALPWIGRQYAFRDWQRYCEVHGLPLRKITVPADSNDPEKDQLFQSIIAMASETTVMLPQDPKTGAGWDLNYLEAGDGSWQTFNAMREECSTSMAISILGQNLTTEVQGGSYAAAKAHGNVRQDYLEADAMTLASAFRRQVLRPWAEFNYGDPGLAPHPRWDVAPPEDAKSRADMLVQVGAAIKALAEVAPDLDKKALLATFSVPTLDATPDDVSKGQLFEYHFKYGIITTNEARATLGLEPRAGGDEPPVATPDAATPPPEGHALPPAPQGDPAAPPSAPEAPVLNSRQLLAQGTPPSAVAGQRYADAVVDAATHRAAAAIKPDVDAVLEAIASGASPKDVRQRVLAHYRTAKAPAQLATLTAAATTAAHLAGRHSVDLET